MATALLCCPCWVIYAYARWNRQTDKKDKTDRHQTIHFPLRHGHHNNAFCTANCYLMAVPQALQRGILAPPNTAGRLFASPAFPTRIFRGPVGMWGCQAPGLGAAAAAGAGGGAAWDTGDLPQHRWTALTKTERFRNSCIPRYVSKFCH